MDKKGLYNVDCLEFMENIEDESVEMTLTDIPYGEVNREDSGLRNLDKGKADVVDFDIPQFLQEVKRITKGSIYIWCGTEQVSFIRNFLDGDLSTRIIVWEKTNPPPLNGQYLWLSGIELCVFGRKANATWNGHCDNTVLRHSNGSSKRHPTEKNLDLFKELIEKSTNKGDTVFDPMCGSGTALVGAEELGRNWIGCEKSKEYYEVSKRRIQGKLNNE